MRQHELTICRNVIRTAKSLAQYHGEKLDEHKLLQVVRIQQEFEDELDLSKGANHGTSNGVNGEVDDGILEGEGKWQNGVNGH